MEAQTDREIKELNEQILLRYLDERLDETQKAQVDVLLKRDAAARRTLDALREESQLLRSAFANLAEPQNKIGEKVVAYVYAQHKRKLAQERTRRFRNRLFGGLAAAACLFMAIMTLGPKPSAGQWVSGSGLSIIRKGSDPIALNRGESIFEGDLLQTQLGEFARLKLSDGSELNLDERSKVYVKMAGVSPMLELQTGRIHVIGGSGPKPTHGLLVNCMGTNVRIEAGTDLELWIAEKIDVSWPHALGGFAPHESPASQTRRVVCMTVLDGFGYIHTKDNMKGHAIGANRRVFFDKQSLPNDGLPIYALHALDARREEWSALTHAGPVDLHTIGLIDAPNWRRLAHDLMLHEDLRGGESAIRAVNEAIEQLVKATKLSEPVARAAALALGQQQLRTAYLDQPLSDGRRWRARMMEGLAHFERGRALMAASMMQDSPTSAFDAAYIALTEALEGTANAQELTANVAPGLAKQANPLSAGLKNLEAYGADAQALLLAKFFQPWALYLSQDTQESEYRELAIKLFKDAESYFGEQERTFEATALRLGYGMALTAVGRNEEAAAILEDVCTTSVAGLQDKVRAQIEGIRQMAHLERIRLYLIARDLNKAQGVIEEYRIRYPLNLDSSDFGWHSIKALYREGLLQNVEDSVKTRAYRSAITAGTELLNQYENERELSEQQLWRTKKCLLEAYIETNQGRFAVRCGEDLKAMQQRLALDEIERLHLDELCEKAARIRANELEEARKSAEVPAQTPMTIMLDLEE